MRTFAAVAVSGALGLVLLKVIFGIIGPLLALFVGFVSLAFKVLLFALIAYFIYSLVRGKKRETQETL
jgi:hypothetical protein